MKKPDFTAIILGLVQLVQDAFSTVALTISVWNDMDKPLWAKYSIASKYAQALANNATKLAAAALDAHEQFREAYLEEKHRLDVEEMEQKAQNDSA